MKYIKYYRLFLIISLVIFCCSSCNIKVEPEILYLEEGPHTFEQILISPKNRKMNMEFVEEKYLSSGVSFSFVINPRDLYESLFNFDYTLNEETFYDCYVFDIEGYDNLKLYAYFTKSFVYDGGDYSKPCLMQTVLVDETKKDSDIEFYIGDSIDKVKEYYPDIKIFSTDVFDDESEITRYFDILNKSGIYTYTLNDDGIISDKTEIDLMEIQASYTNFNLPVEYSFRKRKLCYSDGEYYLEIQPDK